MGTSSSAAVVCVALRFWTQSHLWLDEALSVNIARLPVADIPEALRHDGHPPLYYFLLHGWMRCSAKATSPSASLSGVFAVAALPLVWFAGRRLGGSHGGVARGRGAGAQPIAARGTQPRPACTRSWSSSCSRAICSCDSRVDRHNVLVADRHRGRHRRPAADPLLGAVPRRGDGRSCSCCRLRDASTQAGGRAGRCWRSAVGSLAVPPVAPVVRWTRPPTRGLPGPTPIRAVDDADDHRQRFRRERLRGPGRSGSCCRAHAARPLRRSLDGRHRIDLDLRTVPQVRTEVGGVGADHGHRPRRELRRGRHLRSRGTRRSSSPSLLLAAARGHHPAHRRLASGS